MARHSDPDWKGLFETAFARKLAGCLERALPEKKYAPFCAEVLQGIRLDGENFDRLKARALLHRSSDRAGCDAKCASIPPAAPTPSRRRPTPPRPAVACTFHPLPSA